MTDLSPDEQALFEAWALARGLSAADNHGQYRSGLTYLAAAAWSACLAAKREVWQPIETAPKDGSLIIAFKFGALPMIVAWLPRSENRSKNSDWWYSPTNPIGDISGLTHWMPLPPSPADSATRQQPTPTEIEVLRKDAERYRWLRDVGQDTAEVFFATDKNASGWGAWDSHEDKDAAIDAAIRAEKGE